MTLLTLIAADLEQMPALKAMDRAQMPPTASTPCREVEGAAS